MKHWMTWSALALALTGAALAHEMAHEGAVGGMLHIEPDDAPVVGAANVTWIELTLRGGQPVAALCACTLNVYAGTYKVGAKPVASPVVKAVQDKLNTAITFPKVGAYTLVLTGKPKAGTAFAPFTLQWVVRADDAN